jgi:hypothetical protein
MGWLSGRVSLLAGVILLLSTTSRVDAAAGLLTQSDAPPGFGTLHSKMYTTWVTKMKVVTQTKGMGKSNSSCDMLKAYKADGWIRGLIQAFDSPGLLNDFELCENVFSSTTGSQSAYATAVSELTKAAAKVKGMKSIPGATIGDASKGVYGVHGGFINAEMLFRHETAVVVLIYLGGSQFTGSAFVRTAQRANGRIR